MVGHEHFAKSRFSHIATWKLTKRLGKHLIMYHFHLFIFITVVVIIRIYNLFLILFFFMQQIKYFYQILSEISCAISCCLPTSQLATVTHAKFESKYFISLKLGNYQLPRMSSKFGGTCRSRELYSQDDKLWNFCQNLSLGQFFPQDYLFFLSKQRKLTPMLMVWLFIYLIEFH